MRHIVRRLQSPSRIYNVRFESLHRSLGAKYCAVGHREDARRAVIRENGGASFCTKVLAFCDSRTSCPAGAFAAQKIILSVPCVSHHTGIVREPILRQTASPNALATRTRRSPHDHASWCSRLILLHEPLQLILARVAPNPTPRLENIV